MRTAKRLPTKERLKKAALALFSQSGVDAVSVRDIVKASKVSNASALNYYFGSKEKLIEELIRDALIEANARWESTLGALEAEGGPTSIRQVVEILTYEGLRVSPDGNESTARFFSTLLVTRRHVVTDTVKQLGFTAYDRAFAHIHRLMPAMPDSVKKQRLLFYFYAASSVLALLEGAATGDGGFSRPWADSDPMRNFVESAVGMLEAPYDPTR